MAQYPISRGGRKVELTQEQEQKAQQIAFERLSKEGGGQKTLGYYDRLDLGDAIWRRTNFLIGTQQRKQYFATKSSIDARRAGIETGKIKQTPRKEQPAVTKRVKTATGEVISEGGKVRTEKPYLTTEKGKVVYVNPNIGEGYKRPATITEKEFYSSQVPEQESTFNLLNPDRQKYSDFEKEGKVKGFFKSLFTPSPSPEELKNLPENKRGREAAKSIFLGGLRGISEKFKGGESTSSKVVGELIPTTAASVLFLRLFPALPKVARIPLAGTVSYGGIRIASNPSLTPPERIAGGIVGGLAGIGTVFESGGLIKGRFATVSTKTQREGFLAIERIGELEKIALRRGLNLKRVSNEDTSLFLFKKTVSSRIGLIESKSPRAYIPELPKSSPLRRGGFGVKQSEKELFLGEQVLATSQRGFFKTGKEIVIERAFYTSPQEPTLKIPETRISRLGISPLLGFPRQAKLGFGFPNTPQIGLIKGSVSRIELGKIFSIGKGSELEALKTFGTIKDVQRIGRTSIYGEGVDIFSFSLGGISKIKPNKINLEGSSLGKTYVSGESTLGVGLSQNFKITPEKTSSVNFYSSKLILPSPIVIPVSKKLSSKTLNISSNLTFNSPSLNIKTSNLGIPSKTPTSTKLITPTTTTSTKISPPFIPSLRIFPSKTNNFSNSYNIPSPSNYYDIPPSSRRQTRPKSPTFSVAVRRYGTFRPIGSGLSFKKAVSVGRSRVGRTLAATFKIIPETGTSRGIRTPAGFRRKKRKEGILFIEQPKFRLSTGTEIKEIQLARLKL